jgi:multiple sugar transport system permease protein
VLSTIAWQWILDPRLQRDQLALLVAWHRQSRPELARQSLPRDVLADHGQHLARLPFYAITLLAGLQTISPELYEAATIDGAGRFGPLPLRHPAAAQADHLHRHHVLGDLHLRRLPADLRADRGGPANATHVFATYAFDIAMGAGQFGQGASIALSMVPPLALIILAMAIYLRPSKS